MSAAPTTGAVVAARPISPAQARFWFLRQLWPERPLYNLCSAVRLRGVVDPAAVAASLHAIARRHEILRSRFRVHAGQPVVEIGPDHPIPVTQVDLSGLPAAVVDAERARVAHAFIGEPHDFEAARMLRAALLRTAQDEHTLLLGTHHIVSDAWSTRILVDEFLEVYRALSAGRAPSLPPLPVQYDAVAAWSTAWRRSPEHARQLTYWKARLTGLAQQSLPADHDVPEAALAVGLHQVALSPELCAQLSACARRERVTLFMLLLTAFKLTLARHLDQDDIAVGTIVALRESDDTQRLIGPLLNTLVLRTDLTGHPTVREALTRVRATCLEAYDHQDIQFEDVVTELGAVRDPLRNPLCDIVFQYVPDRLSESPGPEVDVEEVELGHAELGLTIDVTGTSDHLLATARFQTARYDARSIEDLLDRWLTMLRQMIAAPQTATSELTLVDADGTRALITASAGTPAPTAQGTVLDLIESHARHRPDAVAVVAGMRRITYAELDQHANQLAHWLRQAGVTARTPVGILLDRSADAIVTVLAVWKAGAAYVPLDIHSPAPRLGMILDDADVRLVLTHQEFGTLLGHVPIPVVAVDTERAAIEALPTEPVPRSTVPASACYLMYTSGSTGKPKGVTATHGGLRTIYEAWDRAFRVAGGIRAHLQMANFCFDGFLGELTRALCSGATLVVCPRELLLAPGRLIELMRTERVDVADFVPPVLRALTAYAEHSGTKLDGLRLVIVGSDTFPVAELARVQRVCGQDTRIVNCYGLTEATIDSTYFVLTNDTGPAGVLIGRPLPGTTAYVLDRQLRPAPPGTVGTLFIGEPTLAHGYRRDPAGTAHAFIPDPNSSVPGARMYRTGDHARYRHTALGPQIEFLGRRDHQIKVRGYRVEIGEIEAAIRLLEGVRDGIVVVDENNPARQCVHAYLVTDAAHDTTDWHLALRERLPLYLTPDAITVLAELPQTVNGKPDRAALTASHDIDRAPRGSTAPPHTATERRLADLWRQLLPVQEFGRHDDFFLYGGNSLLAMQLIALIQDEWDIQISVRRFFRGPTLAHLATAIDEEPPRPAGRNATNRVVPVAREVVVYVDDETSPADNERRQSP